MKTIDQFYHGLKKISWVSVVMLLAACSLLPLPKQHQSADISNLYVKEKVPALLREADDFYRAGNLSSAEDKYLAVLELDAKQPRALYRMGNIAFKQAQYEKARDYFSRTVDADPGNSKAHYNLAVTHITLAQEDFRAYVAGEPDNIHRPQIETLMRRIDEFAQDKPSDATVPVMQNNSQPAAAPVMQSVPVAPMVQPMSPQLQLMVKPPVRKKFKKPSRKINMQQTEQQNAPVISPQEKPAVKPAAPQTMQLKAMQPKTTQPAGLIEADPLDALANQLKK